MEANGNLFSLAIVNRNALQFILLGVLVLKEKRALGDQRFCASLVTITAMMSHCVGRKQRHCVTNSRQTVNLRDRAVCEKNV